MLNDRIEQVTRKVDPMDKLGREHDERLVRLETFVEFVRSASSRRALPPDGR